MLEKVWTKANTLALLVGMLIDTATMEDGMEIPEKARNPTKVKVKVKSLSRVLLFATPWTVALQAPLSMGFSRQEQQSHS